MAAFDIIDLEAGCASSTKTAHIQQRSSMHPTRFRASRAQTHRTRMSPRLMTYNCEYRFDFDFLSSPTSSNSKSSDTISSADDLLRLHAEKRRLRCELYQHVLTPSNSCDPDLELKTDLVRKFVDANVKLMASIPLLQVSR